MADDPTKTRQDRKLISLEQEYEVRSWCESLGCTREQLQQAVKAVGNSADKVREYLGAGDGDEPPKRAARHPAGDGRVRPCMPGLL